MKIYVLTDMEAVAGVANSEDWCLPDGMNYFRGKELTTQEVNAVVDGLFAGGATEVVVLDGHGKGGLNVESLDPRVEMIRGKGTEYPAGLDSSFDAITWVGQHAKAGTDYSHLTHTQSFGYLDFQLNGYSIGEFGQACLCAMEMGVAAIFAAGEAALEVEARGLVPDIHFAAVKRGLVPDEFNHLPEEEYRRAKAGAIHLSPERARQLIRVRAEGAMRAFREAPERFKVARKFTGPYRLEAVHRGPAEGDPPRTKVVEAETIQDTMRAMFGILPPKKG